MEAGEPGTSFTQDAIMEMEKMDILCQDTCTVPNEWLTGITQLIKKQWCHFS
jgi:hypothetical protein